MKTVAARGVHSPRGTIPAGTIARGGNRRSHPCSVRAWSACASRRARPGSLHLGGALSAVANRRFADEHGGTLPAPDRRHRCGAERRGRRRGDRRGSRVARHRAGTRGRCCQSERFVRHREAAHRSASPTRRARFASGRRRSCARTARRPISSRPRSTTSTSRSRTSSAAPTIARTRSCRPRSSAALGGEPPEYIHHGLLLGEDGHKLSKRHGASSLADLREAGIPPEAVRAYLEELGLPRHDVHLDLARLRRLSIDALGALSRRGARGARRRARVGRAGAARRARPARGARVRASTCSSRSRSPSTRPRR